MIYKVNRKIKRVVMLAVIRFALGARPGVSHNGNHRCQSLTQHLLVTFPVSATN